MCGTEKFLHTDIYYALRMKTRRDSRDTKHKPARRGRCESRPKLRFLLGTRRFFPAFTEPASETLESYFWDLQMLSIERLRVAHLRILVMSSTMNIPGNLSIQDLPPNLSSVFISFSILEFYVRVLRRSSDFRFVYVVSGTMPDSASLPILFFHLFATDRKLQSEDPRSQRRKFTACNSSLSSERASALHSFQRALMRRPALWAKSETTCPFRIFLFSQQGLYLSSSFLLRVFSRCILSHSSAFPVLSACTQERRAHSLDASHLEFANAERNDLHTHEWTDKSSDSPPSRDLVFSFPDSARVRGEKRFLFSRGGSHQTDDIRAWIQANSIFFIFASHTQIFGIVKLESNPRDLRMRRRMPARCGIRRSGTVFQQACREIGSQGKKETAIPSETSWCGDVAEKAHPTGDSLQSSVQFATDLFRSGTSSGEFRIGIRGTEGERNLRLKLDLVINGCCMCEKTAK